MANVDSIGPTTGSIYNVHLVQSSTARNLVPTVPNLASHIVNGLLTLFKESVLHPTRYEHQIPMLKAELGLISSEACQLLDFYKKHRDDSGSYPTDVSVYKTFVLFT